MKSIRGLPFLNPQILVLHKPRSTRDIGNLCKKPPFAQFRRQAKLNTFQRLLIVAGFSQVGLLALGSSY